MRILFSEPGVTMPLAGPIVSSDLLEIETNRAIDRERLLGHLDDASTAQKLNELSRLLARVDLFPIGADVVRRAKGSFAVNVRALDAIHVASAEILAAEGEGDPLVFWTHDERQAIAARSRGLDVRGIE